MVTLTVVASIPFIHTAIGVEEKKAITVKKERSLLKEHGKAVSIFMSLFLGFVASFCLLYLFLPSEVTQNVFSTQIETIITVNPALPAGNFISSFNTLNMILLNNFKILFFCIAFSFFYGAGAAFILSTSYTPGTCRVPHKKVVAVKQNSCLECHGPHDWMTE